MISQKKIYHVDKIFCHNQKKNFLKNTFKVAIQYLFNVLLVFNIVFYLKLYFKLKIDPKMRSFNNLEEIFKTWRKFPKIFWPPCLQGNGVTQQKLDKKIVLMTFLHKDTFAGRIIFER